MDPPPCIQNAMLTKDKKPFTYTPGGLNLSEIRSPRMARRIEKNAAFEGVGPSSPQPGRSQIPLSSLPPSAVAAMQPQIHVQVFPSGPPPAIPNNHSRGAVPPPPPPPPSPLRIPIQPLPTQKVRTSDQQIVERPDMTKIIPENPMAMLKKTGGPKIKNSLLDEIYREGSHQQSQQDSAQPTSPRSEIFPQVAQAKPSYENDDSQPPSLLRYQPNQNPQHKQQPHFASPQMSIPSASTQKVQYPQQLPKVQQQWKPPPLIDLGEPLDVDQKNVQLEMPVKVSHVGSIYIPPINTQPSRSEVGSPATPQSPRVQTPGTPTLKEAPKPWQQKQQKKELVPEWAKRESDTSSSATTQECPSSSSTTMNPQFRWHPNDLPIANQNQEFRRQPDRYEPLERPHMPQIDPRSHPNAVFVTQPIVLQHPGDGYGQLILNKHENINVAKQEGDAVIIPVQVEGAESQNRRTAEHQARSFRVIPKATGTESDNLGFDEDTVHSPKFPKHFQHDHGVRNYQPGISSPELMNRFKPVPHETRSNTPHVRHIPIQIEGGNAPTGHFYVPPSQQTPAEEPRKYTGSSIPSRSFKMLQAMTSDSCANAKAANETNEHFDLPYHYNNWAFPHAYAMYNPHPYWPPYYPLPQLYDYLSNQHTHSNSKVNRSFSGRRTPLPFASPPTDGLGDRIDRNYTSRSTPSFSRVSENFELEELNSQKTPTFTRDLECNSNRSTPLPAWLGCSPQFNSNNAENNQEEIHQNYYPPHSLYYENDYIPCNFGYPSMSSPSTVSYPTSEIEEVDGCSPRDETTCFHRKSKKPAIHETKDKSPHNSTLDITASYLEKNIINIISDESSSDSDTETEVNEKPSSTMGKLQTIKSVPDINVYEISDEETEPSEEGECSEDSSSMVEDDAIPHQLSIILEVSERTESPKYVRECSVTSDCTTVDVRSDEENEESDFSLNKQWITNNLLEIASRIQNSINARIQLDEFEGEMSFATEEDQNRNHCHSLKDIQETNASSNIIPEILENCENSDFGLDEEPCESVSHDEEAFLNNQDVTKNVNINSQNERENSPTNTQENHVDTIEKVDEVESSDSEDWWGVIGKEEDDIPVRRTYEYNKDDHNSLEDEKREMKNTYSDEIQAIVGITNNRCPAETIEVDELNKIQETLIIEEEYIISDNGENEDIEVNKLETASAHSSPSSASSRKVSSVDSDGSSSSESENDDSSIEERQHDFNNNDEKCEEPSLVIPTIKDRIKALQESIAAKRKILKVDVKVGEENKSPVNVQVSTIEITETPKSKTVSAKSSLKSFDEISEEDSGVTDLSSQFLDNEEFPELKKMNKYQRASTHSRLFELLQEECENESEEQYDIGERKSQLSLPLTENANERLANELVQSMLKQRGGQIFRNVSMDKLHAAARKILQEENDSFDTPSEGFSEFLSPIRNDTGNSTPQEFYGYYNEYMQYYDSWAQATVPQDHNFELTQSISKNYHDAPKSTFFSSTAKCPRVLSGKNVHSDLKKLAECPEEVPPLSHKIPDSKS